VLLLLNIMATVFPERAPSKFLGTDPDLTACLCECALRTRVVSSAGVRSDIDRRCRGANGDVIGDARLEYARNWFLEIHLSTGPVAERAFEDILCGIDG
jgi:hypothetical protein